MVLWLHWKLMLRQADESLDALALAAANVVSAELDEHLSMSEAAHEMTRVVGHRDYVATVLDADGSAIGEIPFAIPLEAVAAIDRRRTARTIGAPDGRAWRMVLRRGVSPPIRSRSRSRCR